MTTTCQKAPHNDPSGGYLHAEDDDKPFDVDGVMYCGRCHVALDAHTPPSALEESSE
jgi:hypothetical protein